MSTSVISSRPGDLKKRGVGQRMKEERPIENTKKDPAEETQKEERASDTYGIFYFS